MWNQLQSDGEHSSRTNTSLDLAHLAPQALRKISAKIISAPIVSDDLIFCYEARGFELAFSATDIGVGERAWEKKVGVFSAGYRVAGALSGEHLYFFDEDGLTMAESCSGRSLARLKNDDGWMATSPISLIANRLFFHDHAGRLWAVCTETLDVAWTAQRRGMISYAPPAVADEILIVQWVDAGGSRIVGLELKDGHCCWEIHLPEMARGTCTTHRGRAFLPLFHQDAILGLDARTGETLWKRDVESWPDQMHMDHAGLCVVDQKLLHGMSRGYYEALDQATGAAVWRFSTTSPCPCHPIVNEDGVIFVARDGTVTWLAEDSGQVLARTSIEEPISFAPAMTDRGLFLVSESDTIWRIR